MGNRERDEPELDESGLGGLSLGLGDGLGDGGKVVVSVLDAVEEGKLASARGDSTWTELTR